MRRLLTLTMMAALGVASPGWAFSIYCCNGGIHCLPKQPEPCMGCGCPCADGHHRCSPAKSARAAQLVGQLCCPGCCDRIYAAKHLAHRWNGDVCCDPEIEPALVHALQCDPCWEVRRAAAWSLTMQQDRTPTVVIALYVSSKMDPHYLVRDKAIDALDVLLVCRRPCYHDLFDKGGDELIKALRKVKYKPGSENCMVLFNQCCLECGLISEGAKPADETKAPSGTAPVPTPELLEAPIPVKPPGSR